jgi:hypothetical protein
MNPVVGHARPLHSNEAGGFIFSTSTALRIAFQIFLFADIQQKAMVVDCAVTQVALATVRSGKVMIRLL